MTAERDARRPCHDPWTDPDPQPGDFDADLDGIDPRYVEVLPGNPDTKVTIVAGIADADTEPA
jgi:hypothetical protein